MGIVVSAIGSEVRGVITAPEQVTAAWLTGVLRVGGALPSGDVRSATVTRVHDKQNHTLLSNL